MLRSLLETIHWPTLQYYVHNAPKIVTDSCIHFWEIFNAAFSANLFHMYDKKLLKRIRRVHELWEKGLSYAEYYEPVLGRDIHIFTAGERNVWTREHRAAWGEIEESVRGLNQAMNSLLEYIRKDYLEIDVDVMNQLAWDRYVAFQSDMNKRFPED